jgi:hypothetical protein
LKLALVSKACKKLVYPFLYRSIKLSDRDRNLVVTEQIVRRMLDPNDEISQHVRDLTIEDFDGHSEVLNPTSLKTIIGNLRHLHTFRCVFHSFLIFLVVTAMQIAIFYADA